MTTEKSYAVKPLTVYLGESGEPKESARVDILPDAKLTQNNRLAISVDREGVTISEIGSDESVLFQILYKDLYREEENKE